MDALMDGVMRRHTPAKTASMPTPGMQKWASARALATMLASHGLTGTAALPVTYEWMMGYPPGWLARALLSAARQGRLQLVSS